MQNNNHRKNIKIFFSLLNVERKILEDELSSFETCCNVSMRRTIIPNVTNNSLVSIASSKQLQTLDRRTMNNQNKKQLKNQRLKKFMELKKNTKSRR
jgi:hypothetical protein